MKHHVLIPAVIAAALLSPTAGWTMTCGEFIARPLSRTPQDMQQTTAIMAYLAGLVDGVMRAESPSENRLAQTGVFNQIITDCKRQPAKQFMATALDTVNRMGRLGLLKDPPPSKTGLPQAPVKNPADD